MIIDGEQKNVPLRLDFVHSDQAIEGSILWGDYQRTITAGTSKGPRLRFESADANSSILFNGLFRNKAIQGRFTIMYKTDPEPYSGRFTITRREQKDERGIAPTATEQRETLEECATRVGVRRAYLDKQVRLIHDRQRALRDETNEAKAEYLRKLYERQLKTIGEEINELICPVR